MIIAIIWAATATLLGIWAGLGWVHHRSWYLWAVDGWRRSDAYYREALARAVDAEDELFRARLAASERGRKARAAQIHQHRAKVLETAAEIDRELGR